MANQDKFTLTKFSFHIDFRKEIQLTLSNSNPKRRNFFFELQRDSNSRKSLLFEFSGLKDENSNQREKSEFLKN